MKAQTNHLGKNQNSGAMFTQCGHCSWKQVLIQYLPSPKVLPAKSSTRKAISTKTCVKTGSQVRVKVRACFGSQDLFMLAIGFAVLQICLAKRQPLEATPGQQAGPTTEPSLLGGSSQLVSGLQPRRNPPIIGTTPLSGDLITMVPWLPLTKWDEPSGEYPWPRELAFSKLPTFPTKGDHFVLFEAAPHPAKYSAVPLW